MVGFIKPIIIPFIKRNAHRRLCQIGVSHGEDTDKLLALKDVNVTLIDPCFDTDLVGKYSARGNVRVFKALSLEVLPRLEESYDCILIDGDHNWYTVFHELQAIETKGLLRNGGAIFLHDVGWPYGRRDLYYVPESIPPAYRHPYARRNVVRGRSALSDVEGGGCNNALHEYGPRNGVLTAVEDFVKERPGQYMFAKFDVFHGLGLLVKRNGRRTRWIFLGWASLARCINVAMALLRLTGLEAAIQEMRRRKEFRKGVR